MNSGLETAVLEAILAPIEGDQPTGTDLRQDTEPTSVYFGLRGARGEARDAERQAERQGAEEGPPVLWRPVATQAIEALKASSKDLEIATWLAEALVRIGGLPGLTSAASVISGLVERHWDGLFPMPDEQGVETRVAALAGLSGRGVDGTLMPPLRKSLLFKRTQDGSPFLFWQYEMSREVAGLADPAQRAQRHESGVVPFDDVERDARAAGAAHWAAKREEIAEALAAWKEMERVLDEKAGRASPSGSRVRELLERMVDVCDRFAPKTETASAPTEAASESPAGGATAQVMTAAAPGSLTGREQALHRLAEVAEWFKRNEPNSPIGFTLDEAVRRARLSWPELMAELVADETTRQAVLTSAGMKSPSAEPPAEQ